MAFDIRFFYTNLCLLLPLQSTSIIMLVVALAKEARVPWKGYNQRHLKKGSCPLHGF